MKNTNISDITRFAYQCAQKKTKLSFDEIEQACETPYGKQSPVQRKAAQMVYAITKRQEAQQKENHLQAVRDMFANLQTKDERQITVTYTKDGKPVETVTYKGMVTGTGPNGISFLTESLEPIFLCPEIVDDIQEIRLAPDKAFLLELIRLNDEAIINDYLKRHQ